MIVEDTRQQAGKHRRIAAWMEAHGVDFAPRASALPFGDYMREGSNISIDTKKDVQEVAGNIGRDHARFVRECERARAEGYKLVILVEEHPEYNDREKLYGWTSYVCRRCRKCRPHQPGKCVRYRTKPMNGLTVAKIIAKLEQDHGVRFEFCAKRDTARRICEILGVEYT
jgi:hypothetical protein